MLNLTFSAGTVTVPAFYQRYLLSGNKEITGKAFISERTYKHTNTPAKPTIRYT